MARRKRFDRGGEPNPNTDLGNIDLGNIDLGNSEAPKSIVSDDALSFKDAFAKNRRNSDGVFQWRGKSYTTGLAKPEPKPKIGDLGETTVDVKKGSPLADPTYAEYTASGRNKLPRYDANIQQRGLSELTPKEKSMMKSLAVQGGISALTGPLGELGTAGRVALEAGPEVGGFLGAAGKKALAQLPRTLRAARNKPGAMQVAPYRYDAPIQNFLEPGMGYKKGGKVKKYAAGGSIRGSGCEAKGKTKGIMR